MRKIDIVSVLLSLMLAMTAGHAAKAEEGEVSLFPTGTGFAEVTAGNSVTYNFDFTNGTDAPITTVAASTLGNEIKFDLGNQNLAVVDDKIVNDKCNVPKLGASEGPELPAFARSVAAGPGTSPYVSWPS